MSNQEIGDPIVGIAQRVEKAEHDIQNIYGKLMRAFVGSRIVAGSITGVLPPGTVITPTIINMLNASGGSIDDGDVVVLDITAARSVKTTTIRGDSLVIGVVRDVNNVGPFSNGSETPIQIDGFVATMNVTGSVAIGAYLRTSATVKLAESVGLAPTTNVFARALSADSGGTVNAYILASGAGGSGGSSSGSTPGPPGEDGAAGDDGPPGPAGAAGAAGATGANGPMGAILFWEPEPPEEPMMIPGSQGPTGATGAAGTGVSVGMTFQNEVKGWPCLMEIGAGIDLVTLNQWWDDEATPTTKASAVPSSGEAGLDAKFLQVIKCVTDANNEGFLQRFTYADEPRIKSGTHLSALVWVATTGGGTGITVQLRNSDATNTSFTSIATDGDWSLLYVQDHVCAGTYVELVITKDTSGTFYAGGSITVMIGEDGVLLPPRKGIYRLNAGAQTAVEDLSGTGSKANADLDLTAASTNLAFMAHLHIDLYEPTTGQFAYKARPNGSAWTTGIATGPALETFVVPSETERADADFNMLLDDGQIIETELANSGGGTVDYARLYLVGWWEWE